MFTRIDETGTIIRNKVGLDCSGDDLITEQSHAAEVNINAIVKKHGIDLIAKTNALLSPTFRFDDVTGNDFTEAMNILSKAQNTFDSMPSQIRKEFDNNPAKFLDFVQNPDNADKMVDMGLAHPPQPPAEPVEVVVTQPVTTEVIPETPPS